MAPVGHLEEHGVRPEGNVLERGRDGRVVEAGLLLHHRELLVASHPQERRSQANHRVVRDVCKLVDDQTDSGHLPGPGVCCAFGPVVWVVVVCDRLCCNLMTTSVQVLVFGKLEIAKEVRLNSPELLSSWCICGTQRKYP